MDLITYLPCKDAVDRGLFREGEARQSSPPNMGAICETAREVASGMAYLHSQNVVHGGALTLPFQCCLSSLPLLMLPGVSFSLDATA